MVTRARIVPKDAPYFQVRLFFRICLEESAPTPLNRLFRQTAAVSLPRLHVALWGSNGILTVSAIGLAVRLILRARLTPGRLTLPGNPWSFGERASNPLYRYLYLHLLFHKLQPKSSSTFNAGGMLPYRCHRHPAASVTDFIPDYYPCDVPRLVSCYALFE